METAMQETIDKVNNIIGATVDKQNLLHFLNHQLAKEKEQIENSFVSGCTNSSFDIEYGALARKYYTQTFNTK